MTKLIKSELVRLSRSKLYFLSIIVLIVINSLGTHFANSFRPLEYFPVFVLYATVFIALFIGKIFNERTLNNMLAKGAKKSQIYLTELVISAVISVSFMLPMFFVVFSRKYSTESDYVLGLDSQRITLGQFYSKIADKSINFTFTVLTMYALAIILAILAAFIVVMLVMSLRSRIKSVICILLVVVISTYVSLTMADSMLDQSPYIFTDETVDMVEKISTSNYDIYDASMLLDVPELANLEKNPKYIGGVKRTILMSLEKSIIFKQLARLSEVEMSMIYSRATIVLNGVTYTSNISSSDDYSNYVVSIAISSQPETPLQLLRNFNLIYCMIAVILLNALGMAIFKKSNLS